jgi:hypothetical protein
VPAGTSFKSSIVWSPLKRAKSTVGVPLSNGTLLPLASMASTLSTCTAKEVTLDIGASVPTTNAGPVSAFGVDVELPELEPLLQPAASSTAAVSKGRATLKRLS